MRQDPTVRPADSGGGGGGAVTKSPFKRRRQPLTTSQIEHRQEAVDNYRLFPSLKLTHLVVSDDIDANRAGGGGGDDVCIFCS